MSATRYLRTYRWELVRERGDELAPIFRHPEDAGRYFASQEFASHPQEHFVVALLNTRNRLIGHEAISKGSLNGAIVHPREVFLIAIKERAAGLILVHNHPTGDVTPSREDMELTARLCKAGTIIGIEVLDSIIVGPDGRYNSLKDKGLL